MIKRHQKIAGGYAAFGVAVIVVVLFVIIPLQNKIANQKISLYQERLNIAAAEEEHQNSQVRKLEYERLNESMQNLDAFFVSEKDILLFISSLERIAESHNVLQEIQSLQPPSGTVKQSRLTLSVNGSLSDARRYLNSLESMKTYLGLDKISLQASGDGTGGTGNVLLSIEASLEWL